MSWLVHAVALQENPSLWPAAPSALLTGLLGGCASGLAAAGCPLHPWSPAYWATAMPAVTAMLCLSVVLLLALAARRKLAHGLGTLLLLQLGLLAAVSASTAAFHWCWTQHTSSRAMLHCSAQVLAMPERVHWLARDMDAAGLTAQDVGVCAPVSTLVLCALCSCFTTLGLACCLCCQGC